MITSNTQRPRSNTANTESNTAFTRHNAHGALGHRKTSINVKQDSLYSDPWFIQYHPLCNHLRNLHGLENGSWLLNSLRSLGNEFVMLFCHLSIRQKYCILEDQWLHVCLVDGQQLTQNRLIRIRTSQLPYVHGSWVQQRDKSQHREREKILQKCGRVQIITNNTNQKRIHTKINNKLNS